MFDSDGEWLRTDTTTEAVRSLEHAVDQLEFGISDAYQLKWALHAMQLALQNFMLGTFDNGDMRWLDSAWWKVWDRAFTGDGEYASRNQRTEFLRIYKRFRQRNPDYRESVSSNGVSVMKASALRDGFEHMAPKGWSVKGALLRDCIAALLVPVRFIVCQRRAGPRFYWPDDGDEDGAVELIERGEMALSMSEPRTGHQGDGGTTGRPS